MRRRIIDAGWKARDASAFPARPRRAGPAGLRGAKAASPLRQERPTKIRARPVRAHWRSSRARDLAVATADTLEPLPGNRERQRLAARRISRIKTKIGRGARGAAVQVVPTHELETPHERSARQLCLLALAAAWHCERDHRPDGRLTGAARAKVPITLVLDAAGDRREIAVPLALHGPGEVGAIDPRVVIRTKPQARRDRRRAQLFRGHRVRPGRFSLAIHAGKSRCRRPASAVARAASSRPRRKSATRPCRRSGRLGAVTISTRPLCPALRNPGPGRIGQIEAFDPATGDGRGDRPRRTPPRTRAPSLPAPTLAQHSLSRTLWCRPSSAAGGLGLPRALDDTIDALGAGLDRHWAQHLVARLFRVALPDRRQGRLRNTGRRLASPARSTMMSGASTWT